MATATVTEGSTTAVPTAGNTDGFTGTQKRRPKVKDVLPSATNRFGIKVSRVGSQKGNAFHAHDIKVLLSHISDLDKEAIILAANNQDDSAKFANSLKIINDDVMAVTLKTMLNYRTESIGPRNSKDPKSVTMFSFYVASQTLTYKTISESNDIKLWAQQGSCRLSSHHLLESYGHDVGFLLGKDPKYTNRTDLARRVSSFLTTHAQKPIPVQIRPLTISIPTGTTSILSIQVSHSDANAVRNIIGSHSHPTLEIIPENWRRLKNYQDTFHSRIDLHNRVARNSRAIVVQYMPYSYVEALRSQIGRDPTIHQLINDVEVRNDSSSGIAYVQYDQPHRSKVEEYVTQFLENHHSVNGSEEFPQPPTVQQNSPSIQPTLDAATADPIPHVLPSRFANRYGTTQSDPAPSITTPRSLPSNIVTKGRPFSQVVIEGNQTQPNSSTAQPPPPDDASQASSLTRTASNCSSKTREELLQENEELKTIIRDQSNKLQDQSNKIQDQSNRLQHLEQAFQQFMSQYGTQGQPPPPSTSPPTAQDSEMEIVDQSNLPPKPPDITHTSSTEGHTSKSTTRSKQRSKKQSSLAVAAGPAPALPLTQQDE